MTTSTALTRATLIWLSIGGVIFAGRAEAWMYTEGQGAISHVVDAVAIDGAGDVVVGGGAFPADLDQTDFVMRLDDVTGAVLWRWETVNAPLSIPLNDLILDATGDVIAAAGRLGGAGFVVKLSGSDGTEIWRRDLGEAFSVAADASGDVFAGATGSVHKLSGGDGSDIWDTDLGGGATVAVAIDPFGDVLAADHSGNTTKLDGSSGVQLWQTDVGFDFRGAITVDGAGDVISGIYKLSGADGTVLWQMNGQRATAVDAAGDVFAVSDTFQNCGSVLLSETYEVMKLSGIDGSVIWSVGLPPRGRANQVAVDAAGDVIAAGVVAYGFSAVDVTVTKHRGSDGTELWRRDIALARNDSDCSVDIGLIGERDVAVAGTFSGTPARLFVAKMTGPSPGTKLLVRDKDGDATRRRLVAMARDRALLIAPPGSSGDPTVGGARLELRNPTTDETATMMLPAAHWEGRGDPPGLKGYQYKDTAQVAGPCRKAKLVRGKNLKVDCKGAGIPFTLDEAGGQGSLEVRLITGSETLAHCMAFGGDIKRDVPAVAGGTGLFKARKSAPLPSCGEIGSPGGAFLLSDGGLLD